jgi:hypothetical protein
MKENIKQYETPEMEVIELEMQDIIASSFGQGGETEGGGAVLAPKKQDDFWND